MEALRRTGLVDDRLSRAKRYPEGTLLELQASELNVDMLAELLHTKAASIA